MVFVTVLTCTSSKPPLGCCPCAAWLRPKRTQLGSRQCASMAGEREDGKRDKPRRAVAPWPIAVAPARAKARPVPKSKAMPTKRADAAAAWRQAAAKRRPLQRAPKRGQAVEPHHPTQATGAGAWPFGQDNRVPMTPPRRPETQPGSQRAAAPKTASAPREGDLGSSVDDWLAENGIGGECARHFRTLSSALQYEVMRQGGCGHRQNPEAVVNSRLRKIVLGENLQDDSSISASEPRGASQAPAA